MAKTTVKILRGAATLTDSIRMMLREDVACQVPLARGLVMQRTPGRSFVLARKGYAGPSAAEVRIVCDKAAEAGLKLDMLAGIPDESGPWKVVRWNLVSVPIEDLPAQPKDAQPEPEKTNADVSASAAGGVTDQQ